MAGFSRDLSPSMLALVEKLAREEAGRPDPTLMPPAEGRAEALDFNRRWNRQLPPVSRRLSLTKAADGNLDSPDTRVELIVPERARPGAILYAHGGGFAFGSPAVYERLGRMLAIEAGLPVLLVDYRLAPEHACPAGLMDVISCWRAMPELLEESGLRAGPCLLAGDSAGATLALAAILHEQSQKMPLPDAALLFYGVYGADFASPSYQFFADGPGLTRARMQRFWDWYAPEYKRSDPQVSPLHADNSALRRLPPLHLMAAGIDPLLSESLTLADRLHALGRNDRLTVVPGVVHGFLQMSEDLPEAREALRQAGEFARALA